MLSKHSPTVVGNLLGAATALAVPVQNDPLVLERTVNHIIYSRNGNGNGNGNGHGNGYSDASSSSSFLYNESDLSKIVFPVSDEVPQEAQAEPEPAQAESPIVEAPSIPDSSGIAAPPAWEDNSAARFGTVVGAAVMGTPMAAGAAHARASFGAQSDAPQTEAGAFGGSPESDNRPGSFSPSQQDTSTTNSGFMPPPPPPPGDAGGGFPGSPGGDFFAGTKPAAASVSEEAPYAPSEATAPVFQPSTTNAAPFEAAPPINAELPANETPAAPVESVAPPAPVAAEPPSTKAAYSSEPAAAGRYEANVTASTSAQASIRPGLMDFFAATASPSPGNPSATSGSSASANSNSSFENNQSGSHSGSSEATTPSFMSGSQASIIQNAIQAAAAMNQGSATAGGANGLTGDETAIMDLSKKKSSKSGKGSSRKSMRPTPDEDAPEEVSRGKSKTKTKSSKSETSNSKKSDSKKSDKPKSLKKGDKEQKDPEKKLEIMGFSLPMKVVNIAGVLIVCLGFPVMVLIANLASIVAPLLSGGAGGGGGSGGGALTSSGLSGINGEWAIAYHNPTTNSVGNGSMILSQTGNTITGYGIDKTQFQISGTIDGDKVKFSKQYVQANQPMGKPILYAGRIDFSSDTPPQGKNYYMHMAGIWQLTKREGYSWRAQIVQMQDKWEAYLLKPRSGNAGAVVASAGTGSMSSPGTPGSNVVEQPKDPKKAQDFFMKVALGIIGIGCLLAMVSLRFFGPSGLLNIWAKKEYIPSQFKSQHFKMVAEMGKPLRPGGCPLGTRKEWGIHQFWRPRKLNMPPELREQNPHTLILGAGAKGKSRLMASMIANDIEGGERAVVVVDSDGALVDLMMNWIAAHPKGKQIAKRVVVIDPTFDGEIIAYNPLEFPEDGDLQNAASSIVFGFKAVYTEPPGSQSQWNQQTANILRNSAVLLMANGKTLTDLPVLLSDNDFRDILLEKVERSKNEKSEYVTLIDAWTNYKRLARTDQWINWIEPILNRIQPMLGDPRIRPILTKPKSDLILQDIIKEKKVLFVKIPQGQLDQNGNLLGSLMVTGVKQAALSLSVSGKEKKRPCAIYLDEFDSFIEKETFDAITSETRKFQLGFCGAVKTLQTLPEDYRNQLIINVGVMAIFALAKKDGDMLGPQMFRVDGRKVKHQTIQNVFNKVNTSPQFELISDEEKLNIDRVVGQEERTYFCYRVGTVAGVFNMQAPEFKDVPEKDVNMDIIDQMYSNRMSAHTDGEEAADDDEEDEE